MIEIRFKNTEIGRIPVDWSVQKVDETCYVTKLAGFEFTEHVKYSDTGTIIALRGLNVKQGKLVLDDVKYIDQSNFSKLSRSKLFKNDLIFTYVGTVGEAAIIEDNNKYYLAPNVALIRITNKNVEPRFLLLQILSRRFYDTQVKPLIATSSQPALSMTNIRKFIFISPSDKDEQYRIATALSNIDSLISELGNLIEKKRAIKQGFMQQLLTGKKRLKGYAEPWVEKQLGRIGSTFSGLTGKTKDDFGSGNAKYITFLNVLNNPILKPELFEDVIVREGERQNRCHKGDLFFNTSSETPEEVGVCAMLSTEQDSLYLNSFCFGFRLIDENIVPDYLAYYFRSNEGRKLMTVLAQGVTRYNMSKSAFNNAKVLMPNNVSEQKAIAVFFKSLDNDIEATEIKKVKLEKIKQGMMQQLLTGKIRLL